MFISYCLLFTFFMRSAYKLKFRESRITSAELPKELIFYVISLQNFPKSTSNSKSCSAELSKMAALFFTYPSTGSFNCSRVRGHPKMQFWIKIHYDLFVKTFEAAFSTAFQTVILSFWPLVSLSAIYSSYHLPLPFTLMVKFRQYESNLHLRKLVTTLHLQWAQTIQFKPHLPKMANCYWVERSYEPKVI